MSENVSELLKVLENQKIKILQEKKRLGLFENDENKKPIENCDNEHQTTISNNKQEESLKHPRVLTPPLKEQNPPLPRDLNNSNDGTLEENKQAFIDKIINSENPLTFRSDDHQTGAMLRYGEFSPNNPQLRYNGAPYLGIGEYEIRRNYLLKKQRQEYLDHLENLKNKENNNKSNNNNCSLETKRAALVAKSVQTDIQNIHCQLVQYDHEPLYKNNDYSSRYLSPRNNHRLSSVQNALLKSDNMDKPKSILSNRRTGSPRERLLADLKHTSYTPSNFLDSFSYQENPNETLERERLKRENYQRELRLQIEEKRRLQAMRDEQERHEQELENKRLEQQLLRMQEEQMIEDQRRSRRDELMRRHSEDLLRRKHEMQSRYRKHTDSESSVTNIRNTNVASTLSHYSPPISRRQPYSSYTLPSTSSVFGASDNNRYNNRHHFDAYYRKDTLNRMDSLNYDAHNKLNTFNRFDSLSRIDSLNRQDTLNRLEILNINQDNNLSNIQRRHSATQQDLSVFRRSPKLSRRSNSSRFEDSLPIPVLKAHSPVAKELKNSIPFSSRHSTESLRKLEDKWQVPAVQKNIVNHGYDGQSRSILTQLGAIRMQLQQEQLRMDETLRKRGFTQSKAVDFH